MLKYFEQSIEVWHGFNNSIKVPWNEAFIPTIYENE